MIETKGKSHSGEEGTFRKKKGYTIATNTLVRDTAISLKAKGLYLLISSYITLDELVLTKSFLKARCVEGEKAFCSAWDELKQKGYLKIYMSPSNPGWRAEYDLLSEPKSGPHTFYLSADGVVTCDNLTKYGAEKTLEDQPFERTPKNGMYVQRTSRNGTYANGINANGGYNINPIRKPNNKTIHNTPSICEPTVNNTSSATLSGVIQNKTDGLMDGDIQYAVEEEIDDESGIPYVYKNNSVKMEFALKHFMSYDVMANAPEKTDFQKNALALILECLVEMACTDKIEAYKGSAVSYAKVIDRLNECIRRDGWLNEFADEAIDDYISAASKKEIKDKKKYMKAVIWNSLSTYKVKFDSFFARTYLNADDMQET